MYWLGTVKISNFLNSLFHEQKPMNIGNAGHSCSKCNHKNTGNSRELNNLGFSSASRLLKITVLGTELIMYLTSTMLLQTNAHIHAKF
jgi:hypothetical protein